MSGPGTRHEGGREGFTQVELAMVTVLLATLLGTLSEMSLSSANVVSTINAQGLLQMQLTLATDAFSQDARRATGVPLTFGGFTRDHDGTDGASTLILEVPSIDAQGQVIAGRSDDIIYQFDATANPGVFRRIVDAYDGTGVADPERSHRATAQEPDDTRVLATTASWVRYSWGNVDGPNGGPLEITIELGGSRTERGRPYSLTRVCRAVLMATQ